MRYESTRGGVNDIDFEDIVFSNYAPDGGLFVPEYIPQISRSELSSWSKLSYPELCNKIVSLYVNDDIRSVLPQLCRDAYSRFDTSLVVPINKIDKLYIMELFHGPTLAFKDLGLNLLAQMMQYLLNKSKKTCNIIVQTSGDTGPAAAHAIVNNCNKKRCKISVLYPYKQASKVQSRQLTTLMYKNPENVKIYATDRTMDEQRFVVKKIFGDKLFVDKYKICAMNSINFVRILGQMCYYIWAYLRIKPNCNGCIDIAIPSGAFGNTLACCFAKKMGVPLRNIIPCTNKNDIIYRIFRNGDFSSQGNKDYYETLSPAMDIQIPYNIERYLWLTFDGNCKYVANVMNMFDKKRKYIFNAQERKRLSSLVTYSYKVENEMIRETTIKFINKYHYTPCPHSACGIYGAFQFIKNKRSDNDNLNIPMLSVMTAAPSKFPQIVNDIMKNNIDSNKEYIYKNALFHHFVPDDKDKEDFILLETMGDDWESKWIQKIKQDIVDMNKIKSRL